MKPTSAWHLKSSKVKGVAVIPFKGATEIKQHLFFEGINWAVIRCVSPSEILKPRERSVSELTVGTN